MWILLLFSAKKNNATGIAAIIHLPKTTATTRNKIPTLAIITIAVWIMKILVESLVLSTLSRIQAIFGSEKKELTTPKFIICV